MAGNIKVLKFGGTSVADAAAFERAVQIVRANRGSPVVVIVSAMSGVTDALIKSIRNGVGTLREHFTRHREVAEHLGAEAVSKCHVLTEKSRAEIATLLERGVVDLRTQDAIASYGERLGAALFAMILEHHGMPARYVDARRCILTDGEHGNANPLIHEVNLRTNAELQSLLESGRIPVLGGFIGATAEGVTTTLGRGSSDYTATLIGAALHASEIQIWTDVDGVQTANPNLVSDTRTVPKLSYEEAKELAVLGARVMHAKMIGPVIDAKIPVRIRNSRLPEQQGTLICAQSEPPDGTVKAIAHLERVVACVGDGLSNGTQGAARVRHVLHEMDASLKWRSTSDSNLLTVVDEERVAWIVRELHERLFERRKGATVLDCRA